MRWKLLNNEMTIFTSKIIYLFQPIFYIFNTDINHDPLNVYFARIELLWI